MKAIRSAIASIFAAALFFSGCSMQETQDATSSQQNNELKVYCFSAGKADAFLFYTDNSAVLIDTGEAGFGSTIVDKCRELGISTIDDLIITHFDKDHVGGAKKVITDLEIGRVLQSSYPKSSSAYSKYISAMKDKGLEAVTVDEKLQFTLDNVSYTIDTPDSGNFDEDDENASNNSSLITDIELDGVRMIFMGDAENDRMREYLETGPGKAELVKLPHHGKWQKTLISMMDEIQPEYAVITSSDDEPEEDETLELLAEWKTETYLTRKAPVLLDISGGALTVDYE